MQYFVLIKINLIYPSWFRIGCKVVGSIIRLPFGTLAKSVTAQTTPRPSGECDEGSGVSAVGEGVTESDLNDCVL